MRRVAPAASLLLYRHMLKAERPHLFGVALRAYFHSTIGFPQLMVMEAAMRIVAIAALDQPNIHPMPVGSRKLSLLLCVAAIAKLRLLLHQHGLRRSGVMWRVTIQATHTLREMNGLAETDIFKIGLMTFHARWLASAGES